MNENIKISERLKNAREHAGLTKAETARRLGVPYTTYDSYERRGSKPSIETLSDLSEIFNVWFEYLLGVENFLGTREEARNYHEKSIADFFKNSTPLNNEEATREFDAIRKFKGLNRNGQIKAAEYISDLFEQNKYRLPLSERIKKEKEEEKRARKAKQWTD